MASENFLNSIRNLKIDRQKFHEYLWENRDRHDILKIKASDLAQTFGVTKWTMSNIMREMEETGRLKRIRKRFKIIDPSLHRWNYTPEVKTNRDNTDKDAEGHAVY